jgi:hypothetical protein
MSITLDSRQLDFMALAEFHRPRTTAAGSHGARAAPDRPGPIRAGQAPDRRVRSSWQPPRTSAPPVTSGNVYLEPTRSAIHRGEEVRMNQRRRIAVLGTSNVGVAAAQLRRLARRVQILLGTGCRAISR